MIEQTLFHREHIEKFNAIDDVTADIVRDVEASTSSWTILSNGVPVCIWGKVAVWDGRAIVWSLMAEGSRSCMKSLVEFGRNTIAEMPERRIEATTRVGFTAGVRFLELLGFQREALMRRFSAFGDDEYLYARVI